MDGVARVLPYATAGGFLALALVAAGAWLRRRDRLRGDFALAAALLGGVALVERLHALTGYRSHLLEDLSIVAFLASGYWLLMLRHRLMPLSPRAWRLATLSVVLLAGLGIAARIPPRPDAPLSALQSAVAFGLIVAWGGCVVEPIVRFWRAASSRPAVQRARLKALGMGYGGIAAVLVVAFLANPTAEHRGFAVTVNLVALALLPLLHAAFVPPRWLRRTWRVEEEGSMGRAMSHLLDAEPDSRAIAGQAAAWAARLVGGEGALVAGPSRILASFGMSEGEAHALSRSLTGVPGPAVVPLDARASRHAIHLPAGVGPDRGTLAVVSGPLTPLFGPDEMAALGRFATSVWAILDHARLVEALRHESHRYESLLQAVSDLGAGVVVVDGVRVAWANQAYCQITGYSLDELRALPSLMQLAPPEEVAALTERAKARRSGAPTDDHYETALIDRKGQRIEVEVSVKPLKREGRTQFITLIRDITARKQAEESLRLGYEREREAAARLRSLDEMKNSFLMAVSHELRTPLTAILGFAKTLEHRHLDLEAAERGTLLEPIARNAVKLERLLSDLLDLDRMRRDQLTPRVRPTDVGALVQRVIEETAVGNRVRADLGRVTARVDGAKVERIVENLLTNAAKYAPADSAVWIRVAEQAGGVLILVEDEGPGVPEDLREAIFQPFRQGPAASPHAPGVGIGLSLVTQFAKLHDGKAWVERSSQGGSAFHVWLPLDGPRERAPGPTTEGALAPTRER